MRWILLMLVIGALYASALGANDREVVQLTTLELTVLLDGKPLADGRIFFHPRWTKDQFVGARIRSGKCKLDYVPVGIHKVTFESKGMPKHYSSLKQASLVFQMPEQGTRHLRTGFNLTTNEDEPPHLQPQP